MNPATLAAIRATEHLHETTVGPSHSPFLGSPPREEDTQDKRSFDKACRDWARNARRYGCGNCGKVHDTHHEAEECCAPEVYDVYQDGNGNHYHDAASFARAVAAGAAMVPSDGVPNRNCPVCNSEFESPHESVECCLWKDLAAPVRWSLASALDDGATWPEALAPYIGSGA